MTAATIKWATRPRVSSPSYVLREGAPEEFLQWLDLDNPVRAVEKKPGTPTYVLAELTHTGRDAQVLARYGAALDADKWTPEAASALFEVVAGLGLWAVIHTTHSTTEETVSCRVILLYSRPVTPEEHVRITRALMDELAGDGHAFDSTCVEPKRDMFRPVVHPDRAELYRSQVVPGELLDVEEWLSRATAEAATASAAEPSEGETGAVQAPAYADRVVLGILEEDLPKLADLPDDVDDQFGRGWNEASYELAKRLIRAHYSGASHSLEELRERYLEVGPPAGRDHNPVRQWKCALDYVNAQRDPGLDVPPREPSTAAEDFRSLPGQGAKGPVVTAEGVEQRFPRLSLAALLDPNRPPREWVVEGLLPAGASLSLIAPAGEGKSLFVLAMVLDVARGRANFAGLRIPRKRRVLVIDMENTEDDYAERMTALGVTLDNLHELDDLVFLNLPDLAPLDTATGAAELRSIIEYYGLDAGDLVVLDSFQRVTEGPENDSDTARAFYRHTATMLKSLGLTVVRTDNTGKDAEKGARGTSSKRDDVDVELIMTREKGEAGAFRLTPGKVRGGGIARLSMVREVDERGRLRYGTGAFMETTREVTERVIQELDLLSMGQDAAWKTVKADPEWKEHPRVTRDYLREVHQELKALL